MPTQPSSQNFELTGQPQPEKHGLNRRDFIKIAAASAALFGLPFSAQPALAQTTCGTTTWNLTAGQTIVVGTVTVSNDQTNIYVTYTLNNPTYPNACFGNLHLWIGNDLLNLPTTPGNAQCSNGAPIPGQFCQALGGACFDATGLQTYTFTIPLSDLSIVDVTQACGTPLYVVTHAEVDLDCSDGDSSHETAFGGPTPGNCNRWYFYGQYTICCDFGPPPVPVCKTAYAKGGWVWTTDKKSNPEKLPSLNLTKNRWGWAINLSSPGITTYNIWMGAGLNNTASGVLVGTLTVDWDGTEVDVTYTLTAAGYTIEEVHIYAGDSSPTTIAPGQYGFIAEFDPGVTTYTTTLPLVDSDSVPGVWLVAHAVVCK